MSLPQEPVFSLLKDKFVVGWKNIRRADYVGSSHGYTCEETAVGTTNGAGPRNMQTFVLSPDGVVLHCLPGFWHPDDLAYELELGRVLHRLWKDDRGGRDKRAMFVRMHKRAIRVQPEAMLARSGWQGFDAKNERDRLEHGPRDTFYYDRNNKPTKLKPLSVLVHERMIARPFVPFNRFDTEEYIDYGRPYYDNNAGVAGRGANFNGSKGYMESQKRMAERRRERAERKAKVDAYYGKKPEADEHARKPERRESKRRSGKNAKGYGQRGKDREGRGGKWGEKQERADDRPRRRPTSRPSRRKA